MIPLYDEDKIIVSATEPTGNKRLRVWMQPDATNGDEIYILNADNVYEEFIKKEYENYSTLSEQRVGTWVDGKPIYRKVFVDTTNQNAYSFAHNVQIETIVNVFGRISYNAEYIPFGFFNSNNNIDYYASVAANRTDITIRTSSSYAAYTKVIFLEYTKK